MENLVLVLGANGQLGNEIKSIYKDYEGLTFYFASRNEIDLEDIDLSNLVEYHRPRFVINCAAYTAVDKAESDSQKAFNINGKALVNLSIAVKNIGSTLIHISSDYVYHNQKKGPLLESDVCYPKSIYAQSKLEGEENIRNTLKNHVIIRTSWLYSTFGNNFVKTMLRLAKDRNNLDIVSDQIGAPTYARDLAHAICTIATYITNHENPEDLFGTYNYANEGVTSWYDFAKEIFNIRNININLNPISTAEFNAPASRPLWSVMSKQKIKKTFNLEIDHWRTALSRMLELLSQ